MPDFIKAYEQNRDKLGFIAININDTPEEVQKYVKDFKVPYNVAIDNTGDMVYKYRVRGHPTTFFIDKNGVLTRIVAGLTSPQMLQSELDKLLK